MGQQVAFTILIVLAGMILFQILMLAKNEKDHYRSTLKEIKLIKEKLGNK